MGKVQPPLDNSLSSLGGSLVEVVGQGVTVEAEVLPLVFPNPVSTQNINDNYCVSPTLKMFSVTQSDQVLSIQTVKFSKIHQNQIVSCPVAYHFPFAGTSGQPQKKGISPVHMKREIKHVKGVSCVVPCPFAPNVLSAPSVANSLTVGGRLQKFGQVLESYTLPFKMRPPLARSPVVRSGYANPVKNRFLKEALTTLIQKLAVGKVVVRSSLAFYNRLFLVPKPNQKWRPILDLSQLNLYLCPETFKMETPKTIRLSQQQEEWVTSLDFSDAYFHIPIQQRSRKYLRFFLNSQTFQFTALPFGLATAPLEFTKVVEEVKLIAQARGIRIHQYLDDWLLRAPCLQHTQTLLALCQQLGWVVNMKKSELTPQQVFDFIGYRFDLVTGRVLPTQDRWATLQEKLKISVLNKPFLVGPV